VIPVEADHLSHDFSTTSSHWLRGRRGGFEVDEVGQGSSSGFTRTSRADPAADSRVGGCQLPDTVSGRQGGHGPRERAPVRAPV